jgi:hypothetical protein
MRLPLDQQACRQSKKNKLAVGHWSGGMEDAVAPGEGGCERVVVEHVRLEQA